MTSAEVDRIARRIRVALGREPGDLLLTGGRVVDVFTRATAEADVVIADGMIAGVGRFAWEAAETIDLAGRTVTGNVEGTQQPRTEGYATQGDAR